MTSIVRSLAPQYQVIEVVHTGDVSDSDFRTVANQIRELAREAGIHRVLADWTDATSGPDNIALMGYGEAMDTIALPTDFRHAHVWSKDAHARLSMDMWKTVENLHGHAARAFGNREDALEWLSE